MTSCAYPSYAAQLYQATHFIPWIIPLAISAAAIGRTHYGRRYGKQFVLVLLGLWLTVTQVILQIIQNNQNVMRPDPYCPDTYSTAFPLSEAFYVAALSMFIVGFTYCWNIVLPWPYWLMLFAVIGGPPSILIWFAYSTWFESLVSVGLGTIVAALFVVFVRFVIIDDIPLMVHQRPWTWFAAIDTYATTEAAQIESERICASITRLKKLNLA